jgi:probable rRNA maturation factor
LEFSEGEVLAMLHLLDTCEAHSIPPGELSVAFLDGATMRTMHGEFLGDPTATDVITFPGDSKENFAGEICISVEEAANYAIDGGGDFAEELTLYLVHGWLHLSGLDDRSPDAATTMRAAERELFQFLRERGALPQFTLTPSRIGDVPQTSPKFSPGESVNSGNCE